MYIFWYLTLFRTNTWYLTLFKTNFWTCFAWFILHLYVLIRLGIVSTASLKLSPSFRRFSKTSSGASRTMIFLQYFDQSQVWNCLKHVFLNQVQLDINQMMWSHNRLRCRCTFGGMLMQFRTCLWRILASWYPGTLIPWYPRTLVFWSPWYELWCFDPHDLNCDSRWFAKLLLADLGLLLKS